MQRGQPIIHARKTLHWFAAPIISPDGKIVCWIRVWGGDTFPYNDRQYRVGTCTNEELELTVSGRTITVPVIQCTVRVKEAKGAAWVPETTLGGHTIAHALLEHLKSYQAPLGTRLIPDHQLC